MSGFACGALVAGCTVTPEPHSTERPAAPAVSAAEPKGPTPPGVAGPAADPVPEKVGDTTAADAVEALRWVAALFATGIDTQSETNPHTAWNRADRSAAGAMGTAPAGPNATEIVDGILKRYREGTPETADPRGRGEKPADAPVPDEKPVTPEKTPDGDKPAEPDKASEKPPDR